MKPRKSMYGSIRLFLTLITFLLAVVGSAHAAPADLPKTGQTTVYSTGDDGGLQTGVAWPSPRFTNSDGTTPVSGSVVVDQLTGLMWSKDGNAPGPAGCSPGVIKTWQGALDYVTCLNTNAYLGYTDWRLPNRKELKSLVNYGQPTASWLNTQGFTNAQADLYWSSTTCAGSTASAWIVEMYDGLVYYDDKNVSFYVWPVRAGQSGSFAYLTISKSGTGTGTVTVDKGAIIWSGSTGTASYGSAMSVNLSAASDSGSTFAGWSGACSGTGTCTVTMDAAKNVTATFTINTYTITPSSGANGTISPATTQIVSHGSTTAFTVTPNTGYTASVSGTCGGTLVGTTYTTNAITGDCTVTASFTLNSYALTFAAGPNGTLTGTASQTISYGGSATAVTAVPDTGYHFVNWTGTGGFATTTSNPLTVTNVTAAQTITANFAINQYTVSFNSNEGSAVTSQSVTYNTTATAPTAPTKTGYTFAGWYSDSGLTAAFAFTTAITADTTLYANWTVNGGTDYTVTFNSNGGSAVTSQSIANNTTATEPTAPTKTGNTFAGWYSDSGLTTPFAFTTAITADTTLYAKWTVNNYAVSFTSNGGSAVSSQSVTYNTTATAPTAPTKTGNTFAGWYSDSGLTSSFAFTTAITADITLYAKWTVNNYTVSFTSNGGSSVISQSIAYNTTATAPTAPTKTGNTFAGWYSDIGLTTSFAFTTAITADTTLYAKWDDTTPPVFSSASPASDIMINSTAAGYTLSEAVGSGSITFTRTGGSTDSTVHTYTFVSSDLTAGSHSINTGLALVSGASYTIAFDATDLAGNPGSLSNTNVTYDTTSASATITSPASGSKVNNSNVGYTLSEAVSSGNIVFTRTGGNADGASPHTYTLAGGELTAGAHSITTGMTLVDGAVYTVSIENVYDAAGNATGTVSNTSITFDSTSVAITNTTPAASSAIATAAVSYTLSEQAASGTVTFTRTGGSADAGSPHTYTLAGAELYSGVHTLDTGLGLVDGAIYTVSFDATDMAGNAATTVSNAAVLFDNIHDIAVTITGSGTVTPSGATGVSHGDTRTLTATPNTGYSISSVTGCGGSLTGSAYTTGAITADCTVTASFAINTFTVTPSAGANGAISPATAQTVNYNGTTGFTVTPNTGSHVTSITGCSGTLTGNTYTTGAVTADCSVTAIFARDDTTPPAFSSTSPAINGFINTATVGYTLSEAVASGSITFTRTGGTADSSAHVYTFTASDRSSGSHSISTGLALASGAVYTVNFDAVDLAGNAVSVSNTNISYDSSAAVVTINSPAANSITNNAEVGYTLSEDISAGEIVFTRTGGTADGMSPHRYTLTASDRTAGSHTAITGLSLMDGTIYTVGVENVTDKAGNPTAAVSNTNITYDSATLAITDLAPQANSIISTQKVSYTLSGHASSVRVTFTWSSGNPDTNSPHVYNLTDADDLIPGTHNIAIVPPTMAPSVARSHTFYATVPLVDGAFYTVTFEATDLIGNPATTVSNASVYYDSGYSNTPVGNIDNRDTSDRVDGNDLIKLSISFGSKAGDANWNPVCDLDNAGSSDDRIDGNDLIILGIHFGEVK